MKLREKLNWILPEYGWIPLAVELGLNTLVYNGARLLAGGRHHYNLEISLDRKIPLVPWTIVIYFGCFLFWAVNYILSVRQGREHTYHFLSTDFLAKCICLLFFLFLPTTNIRPGIEGTGFWDMAMQFLYWGSGG